jgi:hypothetical protein
VLGFREFENLYIRVNSSVYLNYNFFKNKDSKRITKLQEIPCNFPFLLISFPLNHYNFNHSFNCPSIQIFFIFFINKLNPFLINLIYA